MAKDYIVHKAIEQGALSKKLQADINHAERIVMPKYDGCHAIFCYDDGEFVNAYSRTGEVVRSMQHIADALPYHYDLSKGRIAICGEAWWPSLPFSEISGHFRRHTNSPELGFVPFDVVPWMYNTESTSGPVVYLGESEQGNYKAPYEVRIATLVDTFTPAPYITYVIRPYILKFHHEDSVLAHAKWLKALGGHDGIISADPKGRYVVGSGKGGEFIKIKPLISESLPVVGVEFAKGEKTGKNTLSLVVSFKGKLQNVSTGLTQAEVEEFFLDNSKIIGKIVEVEAMGLTNTGLLREPRYKGIRTDVK
jgi:DNA ligase-1